MIQTKILKKFQAKAKALAAAKRKDRFLHVVGKLKRARLLDAPEIPEYGGPVTLDDALWAGEIEPRILEVLPALMATRAKYLRTYTVPDDLREVVEAINQGNPQREFRGIPVKDYCQWLPKEKRNASRLKTFRMKQVDIERMKRLRTILAVSSDSEVLRQALSFLEDSKMTARR